MAKPRTHTCANGEWLGAAQLDAGDCARPQKRSLHILHTPLQQCLPLVAC